MDDWKTLGTVTPAGLTDTTLQLHWAVQLLASAGQTFAEAKADDSHRALTWDPKRKAFMSAPFAGAYPFRVGIRPEDLTLALFDRAGDTLGALPLAGTTLEDGYTWLGVGLATYMGGAPPQMERPEYDMPAHPVAEGGRFTGDRDAGLRTLTALFGGAASLLEELISTRDDASPVLCWPHHFDIATLITLETDDHGAATKTVGVGMAPMGGGYDSWYWYVTPWPHPDEQALPPLEGPGGWHTDGWVGAVLTGEELVAASDVFREAVVRKFLDVSVAAAIASLG